MYNIQFSGRLTFSNRYQATKKNYMTFLDVRWIKMFNMILAPKYAKMRLNICWDDRIFDCIFQLRQKVAYLGKVTKDRIWNACHLFIWWSRLSAIIINILLPSPILRKLCILKVFSKSSLVQEEFLRFSEDKSRKYEVRLLNLLMSY